MNNNVELCSDWLFTVQLISLTHRKETQGKYIFPYFSRSYIVSNYTVNKMRASGAAINMRGTETAFKCTIVFYFHFRDRTNSVYTMERQYLPHILQDQTLVSGAQDL